MENELWWLLPLTVLFFALGWIAARIDIKHLLRESRALPLSYFRGLNFLLNEQPDKAIESFIEVVKVDPQTIDLHFALGNLFRRQGEIDRAIRMHQNLLDRPDLAADKRELAVFELAQDFHRAGLLDRAEELFSRLDGSPFELQSLGFLLQIFEQEKDWQKAIAVSKRMEALAKRPYFKEIAHYFCELAQGAMLRSQLDEARGHLEQALAEYKLCTRATIVLGDLEAQQGHYDMAAAVWQRIESQNPAFLGLVAERLADAYRRNGDVAQGIRVLRSYEDQYPSLDLLNALFSQVLAHQGRRRRRRTHQGRAHAQSDPARPRQAARGTAHGGDGREKARPGARQGPGGAAHQASGHVPLRAMRIPRQAVSLALPRLWQVGDVYPAAHGDSGGLCRVIPPRPRRGRR